jgi:hypothetical protein
LEHAHRLSSRNLFQLSWHRREGSTVVKHPMMNVLDRASQSLGDISEARWRRCPRTVTPTLHLAAIVET